MITQRTKTQLVTIFSLIFAFTGWVCGQETHPQGINSLVEQLPPGTFAFVATAGGDQLNEAFNQSRYGKIYQEPNIQRFIQETKTELLKKINEIATPQTASTTQPVEAMFDLIQLLLKRPTLLGLADTLDASAPTNHVYSFAIVDAGENKDQIEASLSALIQQLPANRARKVKIDQTPMTEITGIDTDDKFLLSWVDRFLIIETDYTKGLLAHYLTEKSSAAATDYLGKLNKVPNHGDAMVIYVDFQTLSTSAAADMKSTELVETFKHILQTLGLANIQTFISRSGFDGSELVADSLIMSPEPRQGLFNRVKPVDISAFEHVPANAMGANLMKVDLAGLYDLVMTTVKTADRFSFETFKKRIAAFEADTGINIRRDLLENINDQVVSYTLPTAGMVNPMGVTSVMTTRLKDAPRFEQSMGLLEKYLTDNSAGALHIPTQTLDGLTFHVWMIPHFAMAQLTPCWTVQDNDLILGFNLQSCQTAIKNRSVQKSSLLKAEAFKQLTGNLPNRPVSLQYINNKLYIQHTMQIVQQFWPLIASNLQKQWQISLPMILPPASDLVKHMDTFIEYSWFDRDGLRCHTHGAMLNSSTASLSIVGTSVAVLLPSLEHARGMARRSMSEINLRQIGLACSLYAQNHDGKLPTDLNVLVKDGMLPSKVLESPLKPIDFAGPSYIYVPLPDTTLPPKTILAYENPDYLYEGTTVLYLDSAVVWQTPDEFRLTLAETYKQLNRSMPTIEFKGQPRPSSIFECLSHSQTPSQGVTLSQKIPFKCAECGQIVQYTRHDLQKISKNEQTGPMIGPLILDCPKCGNHALTQAVQCPKCGEVFIMQLDPANGMFNDKCPKCGTSYAKAWQKKYRKSTAK